MEVNRTRAIVLAGMEAAMQSKDTKASSEAYKAFVEAAFPFAKKERQVLDNRMVEAMKKEAAKGPILFTPQLQTSSPLYSHAKRMSVPDEFKKKLQDRVASTRARKKS